MTKFKFKSGAFKAIHASASALLEIGAINKTTMRKFDDACLLMSPSVCATFGMDRNERNCL